FPGGHRGRVTPVPIPNTEVKPATADGTASAGVWESRSLPGLFVEKPGTHPSPGLFCFAHLLCPPSRRPRAIRLGTIGAAACSTRRHPEHREPRRALNRVQRGCRKLRAPELDNLTLTGTMCIVEHHAVRGREPALQ